MGGRNVHGPKYLADDFMRDGPVRRAHLLQSCREQPFGEDACIFREEAEDQPSHEMIHVRATISGSPIRIIT